MEAMIGQQGHSVFGTQLTPEGYAEIQGDLKLINELETNFASPHPGKVLTAQGKKNLAAAKARVMTRIRWSEKWDAENYPNPLE